MIPRQIEELPELFILGNYCPEKRTGPAIWLRCVVACKIGEVKLPADRPPIIYLPGISHQDLRGVESCKDYLKPLAELQYRRAIWSSINSKDGTILGLIDVNFKQLISPQRHQDTKNKQLLSRISATF